MVKKNTIWLSGQWNDGWRHAAYFGIPDTGYEEFPPKSHTADIWGNMEMASWSRLRQAGEEGTDRAVCVVCNPMDPVWGRHQPVWSLG